MRTFPFVSSGLNAGWATDKGSENGKEKKRRKQKRRRGIARRGISSPPLVSVGSQKEAESECLGPAGAEQSDDDVRQRT